MERRMKAIIISILDFFNLSAFARDTYNRCKYFTSFDVQFRNAQYKSHGAPDGLPLPSPDMAYLVSGQYDIELFYRLGVLGAESIKSILEKNCLDINMFESILDFGCGCGRIMRQWKTLSGPRLCGTDCNPYLINWCQRSLTFAEFKVNGIASRLDYVDATFDFIYAISVFTHLDENLQSFWLGELTRVLTTGGFLLITTHGTTRLHELTPKERRKFDSGELVVRRAQHSGDNVCKAFHPEQYVHQISLANELTIVDFVPGGARDANQDAFLLQKPTGRARDARAR
jgi:ubiquinone/menaquinone biosynthesis C-methylase UbiE